MPSIEGLIAEIESEARLVGHTTGRPKLSDRVLDALRRTDRAAFMPQAAAHALQNTAYPIGHGQTISQPFVVALMTDLLDLKPMDRVLEVGTGSGYQAAILARLAADVFSIERIAALSREAGQALAAAGLGNVHLRIGDGAAGWPEEAPFDAIIVTAAGTEVPPPLLAQLRAPGRLVAPVGPAGAQDLLLVEKAADGAVHSRPVLPVAFVPLLGGTR
ncbi:MAG TPA: protein-L-isoaspartate(D-aspartate) O-methyltransferase [Acetobacteraceae bacterium]|nr:protein-L-isoaspartate(D-aspartate) O-methyltransferase [Acetobacteraceae bacterium]